MKSFWFAGLRLTALIYQAAMALCLTFSGKSANYEFIVGH